MAALHNGVLRMPHYELCLQAENTSNGARLLLAECTEAELQTFMALVYRIKAGERAEDIGTGIRQLAMALEQRGAEILIAGCTEIPLFLSAADSPLPLLSSTDLLVERTIRLAQKGLPSED